MGEGLPRHCEPTGRTNVRPMTSSAKQSFERRVRLDCFVACAPRSDGGETYPPRIGGIVTCSRRQARLSRSSHARNCRSLPLQMRHSESRVRLQVTEIAAFESPGLALTKASSISAVA